VAFLDADDDPPREQGWFRWKWCEATFDDYALAEAQELEVVSAGFGRVGSGNDQTHLPID